jgi:hypothetical protein
MFLRNKVCALAIACAAMAALTMPSAAEWIDSGDQVIDGTSMHTTVYHDRGYAVFENECGSQRLTQSELQGGAKPTDIIPCPRDTADADTSSEPSAEPSPEPSRPRKRLWAAVAAGLESGGLFGRAHVSAGLSQDKETRAEAEAGAVRACEKNVSSCEVVTAWNSGCYYITVSTDGSNPVAWGSGPTAQDAYNECYKRVREGNCDTQTLGGCYSR